MLPSDLLLAYFKKDIRLTCKSYYYKQPLVVDKKERFINLYNTYTRSFLTLTKLDIATSNRVKTVIKGDLLFYCFPRRGYSQTSKVIIYRMSKPQKIEFFINSFKVR